MRLRTALWIVVLGLALAPSARADPLGSWSPLPAMATPRFAAAGAALGDGRVLVAGGIDAPGQATASAEVYDPATNAWSPVAPMSSARAFAAAAPLSGDRMLVAGGDVGGPASASAEIYHGTTNTWSAAAPMAYARAGATASALPDGTVWVVGGANAPWSERYDPATDSWSASSPTPSLAGAVAVPLAGGEVLVSGGYDLGGASLTPWWGLHSPSDTGGWNGYGYSAAPFPYMASAATLGGGDVLVAGGSASESAPSGSTSAEIYDPAGLTSSSAWGPLASMNSARYGAVAASLPDGRVMVAGGEGGSGALAGAEVFSPPALVNVSPPELVDPARGVAGTVRMGDVLAVGMGVWSTDYALGETYQVRWQRCSPSCQDVGLPPGSPYVVSAADLGATIRVVVTVSFQGASASAASNEIGPAAAAGFHLEPGTLAGLLPELERGMTYLQLPVERDTGTGWFAQVSYRAWDPTGSGYPALRPLTGVVLFLPGQSVAFIGIPLAAAGVPYLPASLEVQLYDGAPLSVVAPAEERVDIRDPNSPLYIRDPANPLALPSRPPAGDPLGGARFFADYFQSLPARQALAWSAANPRAAAKVAVIAAEPNVQRFGAWNGGYPGWNVETYLDRAGSQESGTVPMISTYRLVYGHCGHWSDPPAEQAVYHTWITGLSQGIGTHPAVLFLEMDSLITVGCLSPQGVAVRMRELRDAIDVLSNNPHLVTYLDAGAADALPARETASLLRRAGVARIQGFFLNSTHFDWTSREIRYGEEISRLTGGRHFVINTAENGQGPLRPRHPAKQGNEVLCDPPGRGLGPLPTAHTGYRNVDAFAWIANPGVSGGACRSGAPPSGVFWPALALELVRHEYFRVR
ncbi:MAG TPA: glycoside hydrolase family 6 protein [Solirubrobacteraceae bacterium]|nr:glycoside hydrolase family 6 protein [Solirubrobacteraceae bacterium]